MKGVVMRKVCAVLSVILFLGAALAMSQPVPGKKFEFSTAFSFSSFKVSGGTDSDSLLMIPLRFGYFVWKGLEIEPELTLAKFSPGDAHFNLSGNLSYNFKTAGSLVPFLLAGAGFGDGFAVGPLVEGSTSATATLLNGGGGVKYVIGNTAAIRAEYRYTHNRMKKGDLLSQNFNIHQFFIGVALFF
jgi:opacity protein-like surface antigen